MLLGWYLALLIITIPLSARIHQYYEARQLKSNVFGFGYGFVFSTCSATLSLGLYYIGKNFAHYHLSQSVHVFISLLSIQLLCLYGLNPILNGTGQRILAHGSILILGILFVKYPISLNNLTLCILCILVATRLGFQLNRWASMPIFLLMALFDIYAVWMSDIMHTMVDHYPQVTPSGLMTFAFACTEFLGAGDVIFSVLAITLIQRIVSRGAATLTIISLLSQFIILEQLRGIGYFKYTFPCMILISPVALFFLFIYPYFTPAPNLP